MTDQSLVSPVDRRARRTARWWHALPVVARAGPRWPAYVAVGLVLRPGRWPGDRRGRGTPPAAADRRRARARRASTSRSTVVRDDHGIPQIYADTAADLFARRASCTRRTASSRWTSAATSPPAGSRELFGEDALETDKFIRTLGWRRVAEQELRAARAGRPAPRSRPTPTASTPTSTTARPSELALEYTVLRAGRPRLRAGAVDRRSTRWPGSRRWRGTCAATWTTRSTGCCARRDHTPDADRRSSTRRTPTTEHPPIVEQGAVVDGVFEQDATGNGDPASRAGRRTRRGVAARSRRLRTGLDAAARAARHAATGIGCNAWVVDGEHTVDRQAAAGQRPAPRHQPCPGIWIPDGPALPRASTADCPFDVAGFTFSGVPGRGHRPQRRHRLGLHQPRPRRQRPLPRAGRRRRR